MAAAHNRPCYGLLWMRCTVEQVLAFDPVVAMNAGSPTFQSKIVDGPRKALVAIRDDPLAAELLRGASRCEVLAFGSSRISASRTKNRGQSSSLKKIKACLPALRVGSSRRSPFSSRIRPISGKPRFCSRSLL